MARLSMAEKEKRKPKFLEKLFKSKTKKAPMSNVDSGRGGKDSARQKMMDKASDEQLILRKVWAK